MKAIVRTKAGKALSTMEVQELPVANLLPYQIKVKMASSRINPVDIDLMKGMPFLKYKKPQIGGIDGAGEVAAIGASVQGFAPGDRVFFYRKFSDIGTWAEEITINASDVATIPQNTSITEAGGIALPLLTAYEALQHLKVKAGEKILIHGAAGGVGFQATQLAIKLGLEVVATAGERDFELLQKVGVRAIISYKTQDFAQEIKSKGVDYVFDTIGGEVLKKSLALQPKKVVSVHYVDTAKMIKTGVKLPVFLKFIMKMMMSKFTRLAKKYGVELIGQVTGADGDLLRQVSQEVGQMNFIVKPSKSLKLSEITQKGMSQKDLGKVILFTE
ncbi:hypothetical protein BKI52_07145 [marine bacterium AO1-C]|nr:hypothetical protein BKI52_07145 [marine bacterium AO1-C]